MSQAHPDDCRSRARATLGLCASLGSAWLVACSPALDWRQFQPDGWPLAIALPCKPADQQRQVALAGKPVALRMLACTADDHTFAVASADVGDPSAVPAALRALAASARDNVRGRVLSDQDARVPGMTPHAEARRWRLRGQLPDGRSVAEQVQVFAHGTRVFQASVIGPDRDAEGESRGGMVPGPAASRGALPGAGLADALTTPFFDALRVQP